jgi:hypothetical protein
MNFLRRVRNVGHWTDSSGSVRTCESSERSQVFLQCFSEQRPLYLIEASGF